MPNIILTTHQKGGVGKSTLSFNIAVNLKESAKVCIIDFDSQGSLYQIQGLSEVPIFPAEKLEEICHSDFDFVFIDTPPYLSNQLPNLCNIADVIIIPTKAGVLDLLAIRSTIEIIKQSGNEHKSIIVFNMVKPNTTLTDQIKFQLEEYNVTVSKNMISDLIAFSRSVLVNGTGENSKAKKQIDDLTKEILNLIINN